MQINEQTHNQASPKHLHQHQNNVYRSCLRKLQIKLFGLNHVLRFGPSILVAMLVFDISFVNHVFLELT